MEQDNQKSPKDEFARWKKRFERERKIRLQTEHIAEQITRNLYDSKILNTELTKAKADLEQFTHIAAHDLREPLRRIETAADFLESGLKDHLTGRNEKLMDTLKNSVIHMRKLIEAFYELTRASSPNLEFQVVSLEKIVKKCLFDFQDAISRKGAIVQIDPLPSVMVYPALVEQLYKNLIENVLKHAMGSKISIHITYSGPPSVYGVKNTGSSIDQNLLNRLFLPFSKINLENEGLGLGLYISSKIIERHNGKIWVDCDENSVHFKFSLEE
jgi:light-regulated signal transduction histidine kinase (bacteriophytochrome)